MTGSSLGRRAVTLLLVLLGLAAAGVTAGYFHLRTAGQSLAGVERVPGLADSVTVVVDSFAIPHIFAETEADAYFAQGYLHASERLWQMEVSRHIAEGRLSELFGERTLAVDRFLRTLDLWDAAGRGLAALEEEERAALETYAAGVNARIESWTGALPPEFALLRDRPEPWTPRHSLALGKIMALDLSTWRRELSRFHASRVLPPDKFEELRPVYPEWGPTTLVTPGSAAPAEARSPPGAGSGLAAGTGTASRLDHAGVEAGPRARAPPRDRPAGRVSPFRFLARFGFSASNAWAVGGSRSLTGRPLLANDMHLGLQAPSTWYLVGLHAREGDLTVAGLSLPGSPGVTVGYNRDLAWGFSNGMVDDMDFATITVDGERYRSTDGWREFSVRPETIRVRGRSDPEIHHVRETEHGPVLSDALAALEPTLVARWAGARTTTEFSGVLRMNRARSAASFDSALARLDAPQLNVIYAATDGTVGYRLTGSVPRRPFPAGDLPRSYDAGGWNWDGLLPADSLPRARFPNGPPDGYLVSANNLQAPGLFGTLGVDYPLPLRARRITDRLAADSAWTLEKTAGLQRDVRSLLADLVLDRAREAADRVGADSAAAHLRSWNRAVSRSSRGAGVFYSWIHRLRTLIAADEFGGTEDDWAYFPMSVLLRILERGESPWIDDVGTPRVESLAELEERAMRDAVRATELRPWGELHEEVSRHHLGRVGWLDRIFAFNVGPYSSPGGPRTVRPDDYLRWDGLDSASWSPPWSNDYGPSQRFIVSLDSAGPRGYFLLPTGQSGLPFSPNYRDMNEVWREDGWLIPVPLSLPAVRNRGVARLRLVPRENE